MRESIQTVLDGLQRFADHHIRLFAMLVAVLAVPVGLAWLTPLGLQAMVRPLDQMPDKGAGPATFTFLDADGRVMGRRGPVAGEVLRLEDMPAYVPAAFMAMEDRRFYRHHGLDLLGLARAAYTDVRARRVVAGGSSISQQTAKLVFDRRERTFNRKLRELVNTARLEKSFSKRQILEFYLNRLYLGGGAYGVDTAARTYFGVSARNVSLAQAAMLAALTRAPSVFSPRRDLAAAQARAARVLSAMAEMGAIRPDQAAEASARPATIVARPVDTHSYFLDAATEEARKLAGASGPGALIVHTTLNSELQAAADRAGADAVSRMGRKLNFSQVAMVTMKSDGAVAAMVGGVSYAHSVFNRALQAHRQPGSAFKPFVYLAALEAGISPWDWRDDRAVDIAGYQPANYKDAHYGRLRLIDALARSVNTITVSLAQEVGIARVAAAARRMGITSPLQNYASLALGTNEVTPMELTAAYGGLARGETVKPYLVSRIETMDGKVLFERKADFGQPVIADTVRRDLTAMLFHVVTSGTGTAARLPDREAAGKTGTTQDYRDAWFVGFTSDYVASVWVGNDDNRPMRKVTGGLVPAQLWKDVMRVAETGLPPRPLDRSLEPAGITDDFAAEQVAYVDEVDAAAPQIPMDEQGSVLAGSGVSPDHLARNDYAPVAPPRAPVMPVSAPVPQQTDMPWQAEVEQTAPQRNYPPRPPEQPQAHDTSHPADDAYYGALPDQLRQAQMRQEQMSQAQMRDQQMRPEIRQESRQEQPPYYRPWQPVRPTPYQTYLDQPTREPQREAQGSYYPAPRRSDPPSYEPAPRTYYRAPYEDPRAR